MGDTFPEGYFYGDPILVKLRLLREDIKGIKESIEGINESLKDLTERVSRIESRHNVEDFIYHITHKDDIDDDFSPMSDEDTKKLMQELIYEGDSCGKSDKSDVVAK